MPNPATTERPIELPRIANEHPARYQARTIYITMGADRSLDAVSQRLAKSVPLLKRWSSEDHWSEHAARYDETVYTLAARDAADAYRRDLEDHRKRYGDAGKNLYKIAGGLMNTIAQQLQGRTIEGKDGKTYTIPTMKIDQGAITVLARALATAADLEAHALRLGDLLPKLAEGEDHAL